MPIWPRHKSKPPAGTQIDRRHPLAPFLDCVIPFYELSGDTPYELVRGIPLTYSGSGHASWVDGWPATAVQLPSTGYWTVQGPGLYTSEDFTLSWWQRQASLNNFVVLGTGTFNTSGWYVQPNGDVPGKLKFVVNQSGAGQYQNTAVGTLVAARWQHIVISRIGTAIAIYIDGAAVALADSNAITSPAAVTGPLYINQYPGGGFADTIALDNIIFLRGIGATASIASGLYADPWGIYAPSASYFLFNATAAGSVSASAGITLAALAASGSGSFATSATSAFTLGTLAASGSGSFTATASAAFTLGALTASAAGTFTATAAGSVALAALAASGAGAFTATASGAVALAASTAAGSGSFTASASGSIALAALTPSASGAFATSAAGSITLAALGAVGSQSTSVSGSGAATLAAMAFAGSADFTATASSAITLGAMAASAAGTFTATATGSVALAALAASSAGSFRTTAAGAITLAATGFVGLLEGVAFRIYVDPAQATLVATDGAFAADPLQATLADSDSNTTIDPLKATIHQ